MISIEHSRDAKLIVVRASGRLTAQDYKTAIPELDHAMELAEGPLRVMLRLEDFRGWEVGSLWRALEADLRYRGAIGRLAIVGADKLGKWGATLLGSGTKAEMRFFPLTKIAEAEEWLREGLAEPDAAP